MFTTAYATFIFAFSITAPIFIVLFLGMALKKYAMINDDFIKSASQIVYKIGLPVMLFNTTASADFTQIADLRLCLIFALVTILVCFITTLTARWYTALRSDQGVFVQGAFHGNLVILGLAFCANAYGQAGLAIAALPVAVGAITNNILATTTLNRYLTNTRRPLIAILYDVIKTPLIIAIFVGLLFNAIHLQLPKVVVESGKYLSQMVLPLALICIGGTLDFSRMTLINRITLGANLWKLCITPIMACSAGFFLGLRGDNLGILFFLSASPTATISFVMVQAMKGNSVLAANIIAQSTFLSLFSVTLGLWFLQFVALV